VDTALHHTPTFHDVEVFVRDFTGVSSKKLITTDTRLEGDLGVTGDDGDELLEKASAHFGVQLAHPVHGYRQTFGLGVNECLFHSEGFDLFGIWALLGRLRNRPLPAIRDLTVGELYSAILRSLPNNGIPGSLG
jgi:hypothetical protein